MNYLKNLTLITYLTIAIVIFYFIAPFKWSALYFITAVYVFFKLKKKLNHGNT